MQLSRPRRGTLSAHGGLVAVHGDTLMSLGSCLSNVMWCERLLYR